MKRVLKNINSYLKLNGKFVWSWEHPIYPTTQYDGDQFVVTTSYHDEGLKKEEDWGTTEGRHIATRKVSTWYNSLRKHGFDVVQILEPAPYTVKAQEQNPEQY